MKERLFCPICENPMRKGFITTAGSWAAVYVDVLLLVISHIEPQQQPQGITHEFNPGISLSATENNNRSGQTKQRIGIAVLIRVSHFYPPTMNGTGLLVFLLELLKYTRQTCNTPKSQEKNFPSQSLCVLTQYWTEEAIVVGPCWRVSLDLLMDRLERLCP